MTQESQSTPVAPKLFARTGHMYFTAAKGGNKPTPTGQLWVSYGGEEPTMQQAVGVGSVDVMFKCMQEHVAARGLFPKGLRFNGNGGDHFIIHARGHGSEATAYARVQLYHNGSHADGQATDEDIVIAVADAVITAVNGLLLDKSSGAIPLPSSDGCAAASAA